VKEVITRSDVPAPSLPFSAGIKANGFIFTAGQVGTDPRTGQADLRTFDTMNEVYKELIPEPRPGRSTVEARLARPEILVEIEGIAVA
jgi:enamine deaminase RidA (YjgF/YER057c/UK114 family)